MLETTTYTHVWVLVATLVVAVPALTAIVATLRSRALNVRNKILWSLSLFVPIVGIASWLVMKPTGFMTKVSRPSKQ